MKKTLTRNRIVESAIEIFSQLPYEEVAFSQITLAANLSNSLIYTYFKTKEELFEFLLAETGERLKKAFQQVKGETVEARLRSFIEINLETAVKEFKLIKIYREGQYKFVEYENKLKKIYIKSLEKIFDKSISEIEYLYVMSGIRYLNVRYSNGHFDFKLNIDFIVRIILDGAFAPEEFDLKNFKKKPLYQISPFDMDNKKIQLLQAGEGLFGSYGYHNIKISDITKEIQMAVGSFYKYFENKETFLQNITENLTDSALFFIKYNADTDGSLLGKISEFLYLMALFFQKSPSRYQIIRESEYVSQEISKRYSGILESHVMGWLVDTEYSQEERMILSSYIMGVSHYIGIELFFTKNIKSIETTVKSLNYLFCHGMEKI